MMHKSQAQVHLPTKSIEICVLSGPNFAYVKQGA
jgi:hypothetical protein